jgi:hypothetical protein
MKFILILVVLDLFVFGALGMDSALEVNIGTEIITVDIHGTITDVFTPSSLLIGNGTVVYLDIDADPDDLNYGNYEILMDYLKHKLIGQEVYVKDNYAYYDLNGAFYSVSINDIIQEEIWGMKGCQ